MTQDQFTTTTLKNGNLFARAIIGGKPYEFVLDKMAGDRGTGFMLAADGDALSVPVTCDFTDRTIHIGKMRLAMPKRKDTKMDMETLDPTGDTLRLTEVVNVTKLGRDKIQRLAKDGAIRLIKAGIRGQRGKHGHPLQKEAIYDGMSVLEYMDTKAYKTSLAAAQKQRPKKDQLAAPVKAEDTVAPPLLKPLKMHWNRPITDDPKPTTPKTRVKLTRSVAWHEGRIEAMLETLDGRAGDVIRKAWAAYQEAMNEKAGAL